MPSCSTVESRSVSRQDSNNMEEYTDRDVSVSWGSEDGVFTTENNGCLRNWLKMTDDCEEDNPTAARQCAISCAFESASVPESQRCLSFISSKLTQSRTSSQRAAFASHRWRAPICWNRLVMFKSLASDLESPVASACIAAALTAKCTKRNLRPPSVRY